MRRAERARPLWAIKVIATWHRPAPRHGTRLCEAGLHIERTELHPGVRLPRPPAPLEKGEEQGGPGRGGEPHHVWAPQPASLSLLATTSTPHRRTLGLNQGIPKVSDRQGHAPADQHGSGQASPGSLTEHYRPFDRC